jgi:polysaccharide pyruvyl transferase WcaK-like protein
MKNNIIVIGYYNHNNIGDEQYKNTFKTLIYDILNLKDYKIQFIDCDVLKIDYIHNDNDIIIVGGGDILNNYFLDTIINIFNGKNNKIYAISVGIPYIDIITSNKLKIFDKIYLRSYQDVYKLKKTYPDIQVEYIPDISCLIKYQNQENDIIIPTHKKIICISLSRNIYNKNHAVLYNNVINKFSNFVKYLITIDYHIVFVPFNTNEEHENDILIHSDIVSIIQNSNPQNLENITNLDFKLTEHQIIKLYESSFLIIPMRFHACLFSIYANTPFLPVYTSRKITNLLTDISWNYAYKLPVNISDTPYDLYFDLLILRFNLCVEEYNKCLNNLIIINDQIEKDIHLYKKITLKNKILQKNIFFKKDTTVDKTILIKEEINIYLSSINASFNADNLYNCTDDNIKKIIVQIVSYYITNGNPNSIYNHGLYDKMFNKDYNINREWMWIIENFIPVKIANNPDGLFNLNYIDQIDYSGVHRSGWQYVYNSLVPYHNEHSNLYLDLYIDRTFHWNYEINKILGVVPYTKSWCGFIHHTFDTTFSNYNNFKLLENEDFLKSLKTCKALFVLSDYLLEQFISELTKLGINVPIYSFVHPTDTKVPNFSLDSFIKNENKGVINIGGWLRNIYNFYKLQIPQSISIKPETFYSYFSNAKKYPLKKYIIKGKLMNNYFPDNQILNNISQILSNNNNNNNNNITETIPNSCFNGYDLITNNWNKHMYDDLKNMLSDINIIEHVDNNKYDNILSCNIVFLNLIDASAVNTLIECIVRNTPIIINKIPAVVELLGDKYPLYYTDLNQVYNLINQTNIEKANKYLKKIKKDKFQIEFFIADFTRIIKYFI